MSKSILILALCSFLSACVNYAPTNVTYMTVVHNETTSSVANMVPEKTRTIEVSGRVQQNSQTSIQRSLADCDKFVLPRDIRGPKALTKDDLAGPRTLIGIDHLVMSKLNEYQTHIDSLPSKIEQAHNKWLEVCLQKVPK